MSAVEQLVLLTTATVDVERMGGVVVATHLDEIGRGVVMATLPKGWAVARFGGGPGLHCVVEGLTRAEAAKLFVEWSGLVGEAP